MTLEWVSFFVVGLRQLLVPVGSERVDLQVYQLTGSTSELFYF